MKHRIFLFLLSVYCMTTLSAQNEFAGRKQLPDSVFEAQALTPPMGWNSWNKFGCNVSEKLIMQMADEMVASGMRDAGYRYIVIDDCWQVDRDSLGFIRPDPDRFPHGMKYLADYVHSKGLKFGLYSCAGSATCQGRPGSRGHQYQDALTYAKWGVDFLKYDWCSDEGQKAEAAYATMSDAIKAAGRPIVLSICEWGENQPWKWGKGIGQMWRITPDIRDVYNCVFDWGGVGVLNIIDRDADLYEYAGPGHWNDAEMLEVGNHGMTHDEYVTHFSMWCMLAAPLFAGNDLANMDAETRGILTNREAIAVDQDSLGEQGRRFMDMGDHEIWAKPLSNGEVAVCFLNRADTPWKLDYDWKANTMYFANEVNIHRHDYTVRDLWRHKDIGTTAQRLKADVAPHGVLMVRLSKVGN
jgi:alpha-galactosidase